MAVTFDDLNLKNYFSKNPVLSTFSSYIPTNIKDIFKWSEFIVSNIPVAAAGVKKISEVVVTNFKYNVGDDFNETDILLKDSWKSLLERRIGLKSKLLEINYALETYGNCFVSVYRPFARFIKCPKCGKISVLETYPHSVKFNAKKVKESINSDDDENNYDYSKKLKKESAASIGIIADTICSKCKERLPHKIIDQYTEDVEKINIILWNPHNIDIEFNPINGQHRYYYTPEDTLVNNIKSNNKFFLATTPLELISAILTGKKFKIANDKIYHARRFPMIGASKAWGIPKLISSIPSVISYLIYNKANEKIATDYLVPLRLMYPANGGEELFNFMSGNNLANKLNTVINKWKLDPSAIQIAPFPIGTQQILGDGKMLSLDGELQNKEVAIANALGVPIEFIKGGLSYASQGPSLRLLENQLAKTKYDLDRIIEFIVKEISTIIKKNPIDITLLPFKIIDDLQEKATIVQLAAQGGGMISTGTLLELFNMDANSERRRSMEEQKEQTKEQLELQHYQQDIQTSIEEKAKQQNIMNQSNFNSLNTQALMQEAQQYVSQLEQLDEGQRKSQLDTLSKQNFILYATVRSLLEMDQRKQIYQAGKQAVQGQ